MSDTIPLCPECSSEHAYELGALYNCPMCGHEWSSEAVAEDSAEETESVVRDAMGNILADGDTVTITTSMKVKGSPQGIKAGTKVRNIRLVSPVNGHDIDCKVDGFGPMMLKSSIVKKA